MAGNRVYRALEILQRMRSIVGMPVSFVPYLSILCTPMDKPRREEEIRLTIVRLLPAMKESHVQMTSLLYGQLARLFYEAKLWSRLDDVGISIYSTLCARAHALSRIPHPSTSLHISTYSSM
jgi:hypothetical protein